MKNNFTITFSTLVTFLFLLNIKLLAQSGPVAYYPFNGNANDESGNGNNGTVNGATLTSDRFNQQNTAYSFNGSSSITVPSNSAFQTTAITVSAWFYLKQGTNNYIYQNWPRVSEKKGIHIRVLGNKIEVGVGVWHSPTMITSQGSMQLNNWHNVIFTYNGITAKIYLDGIQSQSQNITTTFDPSLLYIGANDQSGNKWNGYLDDIRIYNRALTTSEVSELYNENGFAISYGGKTYHTVTIGAQTWLKENLDIGTMIQGSQNATNNSVIEKYCYNNDANNCNTYGGLYQWNEAMQYVTTPGTQGICPPGWHIPTYAELQTLANAVGNNGNALKAIGQGTGGGAGTNTSGFSALLAGYRGNDGIIYNLAGNANFWSSTEYDATNASSMGLYSSNSNVNFYSNSKEFGFSVRCVKDASTSSLTITSPNGGENWIVGTTDTIKWTSSNVTNVKLEYTTNNGTNWTTIIASAPASAGSYAWTIPNTPSPNCKVRVSDVGNSAVSDISENTFSIILPSITVLTPNGGENWQIGRTKNITWSGSNAGSYVKIEYTTNFTDADWTTIADSSANNGSYQWIVPSSASASAKVRVTSKTLPSVSDESNSVFSIVDIAVVSPNGGETLIAGSAHLIAWANTNLTGTQVKIEYSTNNGTNWSEVANNVSNAGQYNWTNIPATTTTNGKIKVSVSTDATIYDESDGVFAVVQLAPAPSLVSPANNATGAALAPTLVWRAVTQASKYHLQVSTNSDFTALVLNDTSLVDTSKQVSGLINLTQYYWRARAKDSNGWGQWASAWTFATVVAPPAAVALALPLNNSTNISIDVMLQWNAVITATYYRVDVAEDANFTTIVAQDTHRLDTSFPLVQLQYNKKYYWRVRGYNEGGTGDWSAVWNFTTTLPQATLQAPSNGVLGQELNLLLQWNSVSSADRYHYQVSTTSNFSNIVAEDSLLSSTFKQLENLMPLTVYHWRVRGGNPGGYGVFSEVWTFKTKGTPDLIEVIYPAHNSIHIPTTLTLKWHKPLEQVLFAKSLGGGDSDGEGKKGDENNPLEAIQKYWFELTSDTLNSSATFSDSTITDTFLVRNNLSHLTFHYWRVRAKNEAGWGSVPAWNKFRTVMNPPSKITLFKPDSASINQPLNVNLQWLSEPITDNYHLQVSTDANFLTLLLNDSTLTATSKSVSLNYNQTIYWRVRGKNVGGNGLFSNVWHFSTKLAAPNLLLPDSGAVNISIHPQFNWTPVAGATQYHLQVAKNAGFTPLIINDSTITNDTATRGPLENNQTYYWRVRGRDGLKSGDYSSVRNFTTIISPPQPPALINPPQGAANLATNYTFGWNGVLGAEQYRIQVALDQNFNQMFFDTITSATSKEVRNMALTQKYFWRVSAKNAGGFGQYSEARWFVTLLFPPENLTAMAGNKKITLTWFHTSVKISKFNIYRAQTSPASVLIASVDSTQFGFIDTTTLNNQNYFYRVKAVSIFGTESDYSNEASATPGNLPPVAVLPPAIYNNAGYIRQSDLSFDISQCYDPDGWIDSVFWYVNGTLVSQDSIFNNAYPQGMTDLKLVIKDNDGAVDSAKRIVAITAFRKKFEGPTTNGLSMYKDSIIYVIVTGNSDAVKRIDSLGNDLGQPLNVNGHILSSSSIARDGSVYIGSTDFNLYAFNINGSNLWPAKPLGGLLSSSPAIDVLRNKIYIGTSNNRFVCVDALTGNDIWTFNIGPNNVVKYSAVITDTNSVNPFRKLFFSTVAGHILGFKVDEITATLPLADWDGMVSDSILSAPAISNNGLFYVGGSSGKMYQIEFRNNQLVPIVTVIGTLDGAIESTPVIDSLGNIYVGTRAGSFYSIKTIGGTNWKIVTKTKAPIKTTGVITSRSNRIVFANQSGEIYSVDRQGKLYWYYRDSSAISNTLMNLKGVTYWGTTSGAVCAVYDSVDIEMYEDVTNPPYWPTLQATPARGGDRSMLNPAMFMTDVNDPSVVTEYALLQNYPNPFNPMTTIEYALPKASMVSLKIYDVLGSEVATLVNEHQYEGKYSVRFDASNLSSGIYIYRLQAGNFVQNRKLVLVR